MSDQTDPTPCRQCGNPLTEREAQEGTICDRCWEVRSDYLWIDDYDEFEDAERACRECGCTDSHGCPEGCYWVEPDLCSSCAEPLPDEARLDFGPCCACGRTGNSVRNLMMLDFTAPVPGTGWGCFQCGLPMNGATAVLCDDCLENQAEILFVIDGQPLEGKRLPMEEARGRGRPFNHNMERHPEVTGRLN